VVLVHGDVLVVELLFNFGAVFACGGVLVGGGYDGREMGVLRTDFNQIVAAVH
jgi:uncharacterized membrane protein YgcG